MPSRDTIVIGASAGGIESLRTLLPLLPGDLQASVLIVVHVSRESTSLSEILGKDSALPVCELTDSVTRKLGCLYVAPPDYHMVIKGEDIQLVKGPKENRNRPAIDPLFRSAAWSLGPRVIGVILSGNLDDGVAGLWAIKSAGGITIVQDPDETMYPGMSKNALQNVDVDYCCLVGDIAPLLSHLTQSDFPADRYQKREEDRFETDVMSVSKGIKQMDSIGSPSGLTCPTCHGALWEIREGKLIRFRCHTGHGFSLGTLLAEQSDAVEEALYSAVRALKEKAAAVRHMIESVADTNVEQELDAIKLDEEADLIKNMLVTGTVSAVKADHLKD